MKNVVKLRPKRALVNDSNNKFDNFFEQSATSSKEDSKTTLNGGKPQMEI